RDSILTPASSCPSFGDHLTAFNKEKDSTRDYRETIIKQVNSLPTKEDFDKMESRIMRAIQSQKS
ncbi:MAG: hypothetical protein POG24_08025, partial [Acidocella sp.]|nr:hypothetical protein [Acidocella sp.]